MVPTSVGARIHSALAVYALDDDRHDELCRRYGRKPGEAWEYREQTRRAFEREIAGSSDDVLMSSEHLSSRLTRSTEVERLARLLRPHFDHVRIVMYVRRQDEYFRSFISTCIKHRVYVADLHAIDLALERFDYLRIAELWAGAFGRENIAIHLYDRSRFQGEGIVDDFAARTGLPLEQDPTVHNPGLSVQKLVTMNEINRHARSGTETTEGVERLRHWCSAWPASGQAPEIDLHSSEKIMGCFASSNRELARQFGVPVEPDTFAPRYRRGDPMRDVQTSDFIELMSWVADREDEKPTALRNLRASIGRRVRAMNLTGLTAIQ